MYSAAFGERSADRGVLTLLPPLNSGSGIRELPVNFLQLDKSKCSILGSTCLGTVHKLEGLCLHTHSGSGVAAVTQQPGW